ncbi:MAG: hypothetical protein JW791_01160 [Nanoarchaeota archaeon]|nr:hypothetical protein [Nanoarchaeota archaeon]
MNKRFSLLIIAALLFNSAFSSDLACSFKPGNFVWHCSNNSPAISMAPGQSGEITINCCYTGPGIDDTDEFGLIIEKFDNLTKMIQLEDYSWINETSIYPATQFITGIDYPSTINPNVDIPIVIHFSLPIENELYKPDTTLEARADFKLNGGTGFILNNAIKPRIIIPSSWQPPLLVTMMIFAEENPLILGGFGALILAVCAFLLFSKRVTNKE